MAVEFGGQFLLGERVELFEKDDCGGRVFSFLALGAEFVADLSGADQDAFGFADFVIGDYVLEFLVGEVLDC